MNKTQLVQKILAADFYLLSEEKLTEILWAIKEVEVQKEACPSCGYTRLAPFSDRNYKLCTKCYTKIPWVLDEKQKPMILHQR